MADCWKSISFIESYYAVLSSEWNFVLYRYVLVYDMIVLYLTSVWGERDWVVDCGEGLSVLKIGFWLISPELGIIWNHTLQHQIQRQILYNIDD